MNNERRITINDGVVNYNRVGFTSMINEPIVRIKIEVGIKLDKDAIMPSYANDSDSGADLFCKEDVEIPANARGFIVKTGVRLDLPVDYEVQVRPKSGVSTKTPIRVIFGTVDEGYKGEIGIMIDNLSDKPITVERGKALAQMVIQHVPKMKFLQVNELSNSDRGEGGFGSTGRGI